MSLSRRAQARRKAQRREDKQLQHLFKHGDSMGITKAEASRALQDGWDPNTLASINHWLVNDFHAYSHAFVSPHLLHVSSETIVGRPKSFYIYRAYSNKEALAAFDSGMLYPDAECFCDGSGTTGNKAAGIGVAIYRDGYQPVLIAEHIGQGTNNVAELRAVDRALKFFPNTHQKILIRTDSMYTIGSLTEDWAAQANVDLIKAIKIDLMGRNGNVTFKHVDGHSGVEGNEVADQLANIGRKLVTKISHL